MFESVMFTGTICFKWYFIACETDLFLLLTPTRLITRCSTLLSLAHLLEQILRNKFNTCLRAPLSFMCHSLSFVRVVLMPKSKYLEQLSECAKSDLMTQQCHTRCKTYLHVNRVSASLNSDQCLHAGYIPDLRDAALHQFILMPWLV